MRFSVLRLQNFRNVEFTTVPLASQRVFFLGSNGQGKSNLLEALGLATACRSFRTQNMGVLPKKGTDGFSLVYAVEHERNGECSLEIHGNAKGRTVIVDGQKMSRLGDFIGYFPVVVMSSNDIQLLRGGPTERRKFLDLTLSAIDPEYYAALRSYHSGLAGRNRLLKVGATSAEFDAFEQEISHRMVTLRSRRVRLSAELSDLLARYYSAMAEVDEGPFFDYKPSSSAEDAESAAKEMYENRKRDSILGSTQKGVHRDDFSLGIRVGGAKDYASDGQQRALCVALRLAQIEIFQRALAIAPVLLADDVLGELDPKREAGFWASCPGKIQIIATGTEMPKGSSGWLVRRVEGGKVTG